MIFYIMGKSASGKDTLYKRILKSDVKLKHLVIYTTRPLRDGEVDGMEYHFVTKEYLDNNSNQIIEKRVYNTVEGDWYYATLDDGSIKKDQHYLTIGTLESYKMLKRYFGDENIFPIFLDVPEEKIKERALMREKMQKTPKLEEMERRLKADLIDFSEENIRDAGIVKRYINDNFDECYNSIIADINKIIR